MHLVFRHAFDVEHTRIFQLEKEQRLFVRFGVRRNGEFRDDFVLVVCTFTRIKANLHTHFWLWITLYALLSEDVFERHVTHELCDDAVLDLRLLRRFGGLGLGHRATPHLKGRGLSIRPLPDPQCSWAG